MKTTKDQRKYIGKDLEVMSNAYKYYSWLLSELTPFLGEKILEVGAGAGTFTKYMLKTNPKEIRSVEPSKEMFEMLKEEFEGDDTVKPFNGYLDEYYKKIEGQMDSAIYINVLEHVQHDEEEMKLVHKCLKPGGKVCMYVPAMQSIYGKFDAKVGHYRRYSKKGLKEVMENAGYKVLRINYSDIVGILPWIVSFKILGREDLSFRQIGIYDSFVIPFIRFQEKFIKPPIGKNLWCIAEKIS